MPVFSPSLNPTTAKVPVDARGSALFRHMTRDEVDHAVARIERRAFSSGDVIVRREDPGRMIHLVLEGTLLANQYARSGREVGFRRIAAGGYFGEISAIDAGPRSVNVVALTTAILGSLPETLVATLLQNSPGFSRALLEDLAATVRSLSGRLFEASAVSVACRVDIELLRMAHVAGIAVDRSELVRAPTHAEIAVLVGGQREAVTRELNRLMTRAILARRGRTLEILSIEALVMEIERAGGEGADPA